MNSGELIKINRTLIRETFDENFLLPKNKKIGVFGIAEGVGTTFVSLGLAWQLSRRKDCGVGFVDASGYCDLKLSNIPKAQLFDIIGLDKRFAIKEYKDIFAMAESGENFRHILSTDDRINWAVPRGNLKARAENETLVMSKIMKVMNNLACDICICDFGAYANGNCLEEIIKNLDIAIIVAEPRPSKLIAGQRRLEEIKNDLKDSGVETLFVINKYSDGAPLHEVKRFIGERKVSCILYVEEEVLCAAEYGCKIPLSVKTIREELGKSFEEIAFLII